jgi:sec-independent protein translocase protein TatB
MGLFEMLIIAIVALLVVGPERMPEAVRGAAMTIGRIKRMFNSTREEFEKQIGADDIRLELHNEQIMDNLKKMEKDMAEIDSDLRKLTQDEEDRKFMEEDNYQDPPRFRGDDLHAKKVDREEPFAFSMPPADIEPASSDKSIDIIKSSASKKPVSKKTVTNKKPAATKKPASSKKTAAKKTSAVSDPVTQTPPAGKNAPEENTTTNKNKSSV